MIDHIHVFSNSLHCMAPSQVASWISTLLPDANIGTLLLILDYFIGDTSSGTDFHKSDKGTTMKKEHPKTTMVNLKVTSSKFSRNPFSVMIQVLTLSGLVTCQAGKVSNMSLVWDLNQQRVDHTCVEFFNCSELNHKTNDAGIFTL